MIYGFADPEHIKRERAKGRELRASQWWKQQLGNGLCYHCGERFPKESLTMDHLVPLARGGKSTKQNCVVCCKDCNTKKGHKLDVEMTMEEMRTQGALAGDSAGFGDDAPEASRDESRDGDDRGQRRDKARRQRKFDDGEE